MVEMGDLQEGVLPGDLSALIKQTLSLSHIKVIGIGCNLACYGGIRPDRQNMHELSALANAVETEFQMKLDIVSGGNSANYDWYNGACDHSPQSIGNINNLRIGESILLGCETVHRRRIPGLYTSAFINV